MNQIQQLYKRETGNSPLMTGIESELMTEPLDAVQMKEFSKQEIIGMIEIDKSYWSIKMNDIPADFKDAEDLYLPNVDYIKWLEEKIEILISKSTS